MVSTGTEYGALLDEIFARYAQQEDSIRAKYLPEHREVEEWYEAALEAAAALDTQAARDAAREIASAERNRRQELIAKREWPEILANYAARDAEERILKFAARPALIRTSRTIIASIELMSEAVSMLAEFTEPAPDDTALVFVTTFADLKRELEPDRTWGLLRIVVPAEDGAIRLDNERAQLGDLAELWKDDVRVRVPEGLTFHGPVTGARPIDIEAFGDLVGSSEVYGEWEESSGPPTVTVDGPNAVERAGTVTLTARGAAGSDVTYVWTFDRTGGRKTGRTIDLVLLRDTTVKLTVHHPHGMALATHSITVTPRPWQTSVRHVADMAWTAPFEVENMRFGSNRCALHDSNAAYYKAEPKSPHVIHRPAGADHWRKSYELARVDDPGGPDHNRWYVLSCDLRIRRYGLVNADVFDGQSSTAMANQKASTATNETRSAFANLYAALLTHQREHTLAMADELADDPAGALEPLVSTTRRSLDTVVHDVIATAEERLSQADDNHSAIAERMRTKGWDHEATLYLKSGPSGDFVLHTFKSLAMLGCDSIITQP
jgi:hypothetical protein